MPKETWVVVANSAYARIFKLENNKLHVIRTLEHPESRLHNSDLVSSNMGRTFESTGVRRSSYEPKTSPKQVEIDSFAKDLCDHIKHARMDGQCGKIYLIAGPSFLGTLRQKLDESSRRLVELELEKDWTQLDPHEILSNLQNL